MELVEEFGEIIGTLVGWGTSVGVQIVCAAAAALIYAYRGKSWVGGAFLGFFLGPFGILIALATGGRGKRPAQAYRPQDMSPPRMTGAAPMPQPPAPQPPALPEAEYRLPDRCPHCNAPLARHRPGARSVRCFYCGSTIDAERI